MSHNVVPRLLVGLGLRLDANGAARLMGAVEAEALAWLAVRSARVLDLRGTPAVGVFGLEVLHRSVGLLPLNLAAALGIAVRRSALGFLPALAAAWALWIVEARRSERLAAALRSPAVILSALLPLVVLAWFGAEALRAEPRRTRVGIPLTVGLASASLGWPGAQADTTYGLLEARLDRMGISRATAFRLVGARDTLGGAR